MRPAHHAVLALLVALAAGRASAGDQEGRALERCTAAQAAAKEALAGGQGCASDLDCVQFLEAELGCDGVQRAMAIGSSGLVTSPSGTGRAKR